MRYRSRPEKGYVLFLAIVLIALTAFLVREVMTRVSMNAGIVAQSRAVSIDYAEVEDSLNRTVNYMRANSTSFAYPFSKEQFYTLFTRTSPPVFGSNDQSISQVPSKLYIRGTDETPMLTNDEATFGRDSFPSSINSTTNGGVELLNILTTVNLGTAKVRITLVDAIPVTAAGDTAPNPTTDFKPIYRIDAMAALDSGPHIFAFLEGTPLRAAKNKYWAVLAYVYPQQSPWQTESSRNLALRWKSDTRGYGISYNDTQIGCASYDSTLGPYSNTNRSAECYVGTECNNSNSSGWFYSSLNSTMKIWGGLIGSLSCNIAGGAAANNPLVDSAAQFCSAFNDSAACKTKATAASSSCAGAGCICTCGNCCRNDTISTFSLGLQANNSRFAYQMDAKRYTDATYSAFCNAGDQGDLTDNKGVRNIASGATATAKCWNRWDLSGSAVYVLNTSGDYYVNNLRCNPSIYASKPAHGSAPYIMVNPPAGGVVKLYIWNDLSNGNIYDTSCFRNGTATTSEATSTNGSPSRFQLLFMNSNYPTSGYVKLRPSFWPPPPLNAFIFSWRPLIIAPIRDYYASYNQSSAVVSWDNAYMPINGAIYSANTIDLADVVLHYDKAGESTGLSWIANGNLASGGGSSVTVAAGYTGVADITYGVRQINRIFN